MAFSYYAATIKDDTALADRTHRRHIVAHQQNGSALASDGPQLIQAFALKLCVSYR